MHSQRIAQSSGWYRPIHMDLRRGAVSTAQGGLHPVLIDLDEAP